MSARDRFFSSLAAFALAGSACSSVNDDASDAEPAETPSCTTSNTGATTLQYRDLTDADLDIDGVDLDAVSLDVYASPTAEDCPVVIWVHGGSWQSGDKRTTLTRDVKAEHFVTSGYVFVSINYRLVADTNSIRWPVFGDDVAAATAWVIDNAEAIGVDANRVTLLGHSSGAHLVSVVGTNPDLLGNHGRDPSDVACVISLDSVTHDLTDPPPWEVDIIELAFPTVADRADGSPTLEAETHASDSTPDFLIVTRGADERTASSERLRAALTERGASATVADVSPYDHGQVASELGIDGEQLVTPIVDDFLTTCGQP